MLENWKFVPVSSPIIKSISAWATPRLPTKFRENWSTTFLSYFVHRQTDKPTKVKTSGGDYCYDNNGITYTFIVVTADVFFMILSCKNLIGIKPSHVFASQKFRVQANDLSICCEPLTAVLSLNSYSFNCNRKES